MTPVMATIFLTALEMSGTQRLLLMWPLCLAVAVVYKTLRCESLREIPRASLVLWATIVFGLYGVGVALWAMYQLLA